MPNLINLPSHDEDGQLQVVVEAPRGSRAKFKYDATEQTFKVARPLCLGIAYPYTTGGFVPGTRVEDGDPLDAMVYHDMSTYPGGDHSLDGGVVRLIQKEKGEKWERNDRLIVVPSDEKRWDDATALEKRVHEELEQFLVIVVMMTGKKVRVEGWEGPKAAKALIKTQ